MSRDHIESHIQDVCVQKVNELANNQMIWTDEVGFLLKPLEPGRLMTKCYLKFDTMKHIMKAQYSITVLKKCFILFAKQRSYLVMNSICQNGCRIAKCMKEYFYKALQRSTELNNSCKVATS